MSDMMDKVLIIGGSGLLGSKLVDLFEDVYVTYNSTIIDRKNAYKIDISDTDSLALLLDKLAPKTIIVTAALTDVDKCELNLDLAYKTNTEPFYQITKYLKKVNGKLIQISTDYVFSGNEGNYSENDVREPVNVYGTTKRDAENIIMNSGIDYAIIRTSGIFGINRATGKANFFMWLYERLRENKEVNLVRDQYYSPTINTMLANATREISERNISGSIHFSSIDKINRFDFGNMVAQVFDLDKSLIHETTMKEMKWTAKRPKDSSLNNEKAIRLLYTKPINVLDEIHLIQRDL